MIFIENYSNNTETEVKEDKTKQTDNRAVLIHFGTAFFL